MISRTKRVLGWMVCTFIMAPFLGCAVPESNTGTGNPLSEPGASAGTIYQPKVQTGMTAGAAKKEQGELLNAWGPSNYE